MNIFHKKLVVQPPLLPDTPMPFSKALLIAALLLDAAAVSSPIWLSLANFHKISDVTLYTTTALILGGLVYSARKVLRDLKTKPFPWGMVTLKFVVGFGFILYNAGHVTPNATTAGNRTNLASLHIRPAKAQAAPATTNAAFGSGNFTTVAGADTSNGNGKYVSSKLRRKERGY